MTWPLISRSPIFMPSDYTRKAPPCGDAFALYFSSAFLVGFFAAVFFVVVDFFEVEVFFAETEDFEDVVFLAVVAFLEVPEEVPPVTERKALYTFTPLLTFDGSFALSSVMTITSCLLASWNPIR